MQESSFSRWLANLYDEHTCSSRISNCRRIEQFEGDLDEQFAQDGMAALLERLRYSTHDAARRRAPRHAIPITGDMRNGSASLRSAAQLYRRFRSGETPAPADQRDKPQKRSRSHGKWPEWETPTTEELLRLARSVTPYVKFLEPSIVQTLVEDTERHRDEWTRGLNERNVDASLFLWPRTSCAFPGVRRYAGSSEIAQFRRRAEAQPTENALALDDNSYPKHIWSFVLRGRPFQQFGPAGYALAHLSDHKAYKNRSQREIVGDVTDRTFFGLYTSATNAAFVPTSLIRPTDFVPELRNLLQRKADSLYRKFCNLLPPGSDFACCPSSEWEIDQFPWPEPVGDMTWLPMFLEFRRDEMKRLLGDR